jgi:D-3-phosphoglycerate dehydrogenase
MKILAIGDSYMPPSYFQEAFSDLEDAHDVQYAEVSNVGEPNSSAGIEPNVREYQGSAAELAKLVPDVDVLVVHGAPVTEQVLAAAPRLCLVCCARGGPVNIDVDAVTARGLPLVNTPGKNAEAVADLTLAFLVMLARGVPKALRFLEEGNLLRDNWDGAQFIGSDLRGKTLGLVGYGQVGTRVAARAQAFGMDVLVYDPYMDVARNGGIEQADSLPALLARSEFVSLHARATAGNARMIDADALRAMRSGAFLINTARESLVDEDALDAALTSGHLGGAALDVVYASATSGRHRLLRHENVVLTPHIGGATRETLRHGAEMIAGEITRFATGEPLRYLVNAAANAE